MSNTYNKVGELHSHNDKPAMIRDDGTKEWYKAGVPHRDDGPAIIYSDGEQEWYKDGNNHRLDGPAVIYPDGSEGWYKNGVVHRLDGPAIMWSNGMQQWCINGERYHTVAQFKQCAKEYGVTEDELLVTFLRYTFK